jgi:hypothetical protein
VGDKLVIMGREIDLDDYTDAEKVSMGEIATEYCGLSSNRAPPLMTRPWKKPAGRLRSTR